VLIVTEPMADAAPFEPGRHLIAAPIGELADTVARYLRDDAERQRIVDAAYALVRGRLGVAEMVGRILAHAREVKALRQLAGVEDAACTAAAASEAR
jgi:hypothetical protein